MGDFVSGDFVPTHFLQILVRFLKDFWGFYSDAAVYCFCGVFLFLDCLPFVADASANLISHTHTSSQISFERSFNGGNSLLESTIPRYIAGGYNENPDPEKRGFYLVMEDVSGKYEV